MSSFNKNNFNNIFSIVKDFWQKLVRALIEYWKKLLNGLKRFWESGILQNLEKKLVLYLKTLWSVLFNYFKNFEFSLKNVFIIIYVIFILSILTLLHISYNTFYKKHEINGEIRYKITQGKSFNEISDELEEKGIISSAFYFKMAGKLQEKDDRIISRSYIFKSDINNLELLDMLTNPSIDFSVRFTVLEGMRLKQIGKIAENKLGLNAEIFLNETKNDSLINILGLKGKINNLEGFLFPDTYKIEAGTSEKEIVNILFNEFRRKILVKMNLQNNPKKLLEIITLASIVQGETTLESEMGIIAGVYTNRLSKRMRLEADPTIQYVIPNGPKQRLLNEDLKIESPYNTYKHLGLPPGPINNPGLKAIESAITPNKNEFLFFVATGKGGHKFSKTYKEHLIAVEEYRKNVKQK